ncbi:MAG: hypothetical protein JWN25_1427, partial [Verrucomicrobiales bacterium]|nr:hypothetical protein [Verrucomicrobiales bacterium]
MEKAGLSESAIRTFEFNYNNLIRGETGLIPETSIEPVQSVPALEQVKKTTPLRKELLSRTVVLKLNGGLGTSMGLEKAKSLLKIKGDLTFLDFIARQIIQLRKENGADLAFLLMNSQSTSSDTVAFLERYPELGKREDYELLQSFVPKVDANTMRPVEWPENLQLEWCPPGHGDIYPSLVDSKWLKKLITTGKQFLFVSNSDNLGASLDLHLLAWFADKGYPFLMEVAERTSADKKGGHLACRGKSLLLRESAQCPEGDTSCFQDISRHKFFNTNNLWIDLVQLNAALEMNNGFLPLPMIRNNKTVDPRNKQSTKVIQLETAMGAAIGCFENAAAVLVPRSRFAPVKTTSDLLGLRSDLFQTTVDWRLELDPVRKGIPPLLDLDDNYKMVDQLDAGFPEGAPSLIEAISLKVKGSFVISPQTSFEGNVMLENKSAARVTLASRKYQEEQVVV